MFNNTSYFDQQINISILLLRMLFKVKVKTKLIAMLNTVYEFKTVEAYKLNQIIADTAVFSDPRKLLYLGI